MKDLHVSWDEYHRLIEKLALKIHESGWSFDAMPMYVAFPSNRHVSAKLRAFIDWVVELMPVHSPVASRPENSIHDKHCADGTHRDQHAKIPQIQSV